MSASFAFTRRDKVAHVIHMKTTNQKLFFHRTPENMPQIGTCAVALRSRLRNFKGKLSSHMLFRVCGLL